MISTYRAAQADEEFFQHIFRPDIVHRRDHTMENMVQAAVVECAPWRPRRGDFQRYRPGVVPRGRCTDIAGVVFREIAADRAETDRGARLANSVRESECVLFFLIENMKREALGRFLADARKFRKRADEPGDRRCITISHL